MKRIVAYICACTLVASLFGFGNQVKDVQASGGARTEVSLANFKDGGGNPMEAREYVYNGSAPTIYPFLLKNAADTDAANFDNTRLSMKVKFKTAGMGNRIEFGSKSTFDGFFIFPHPTDSSKLIFSNEVGILSGSYVDKVIAMFDAETANVSSFVDTEFTMKMNYLN